jgi:hypothetical protein
VCVKEGGGREEGEREKTLTDLTLFWILFKYLPSTAPFTDDEIEKSKSVKVGSRFDLLSPTIDLQHPGNVESQPSSCEALLGVEFLACVCSLYLSINFLSLRRPLFLRKLSWTGTSKKIPKFCHVW